MVGQASAQIVQAIRADEEGSLHLYAELERTRQALLLSAAMSVGFAVSATQWVPHPKPEDD